MFTISPTDKNWFQYLQDKEFNSYINFWTPTPWNITGLNRGDKFYFMLKSPIRMIGGFGEFVEYKNLTVNEAWIEFGYRNGRNSKLEFIESIKSYIDKNSSKFGGENVDVMSYRIGCIILNNCEFWDKENFLVPEDYGISFPKQVVKLKYFIDYDPFLNVINNANNFSIVTEPREEKRQLVNIRIGQGTFKGKVLKAYDNKCCVTGEIIPELLEAAHIQKYKNLSSNNVQNGLLIRVDIHRLFDNDMIFIDSEYIIHVSSLIENEFYRSYNGKKITLPNLKSDYPSVQALELRKEEFRR